MKKVCQPNQCGTIADGCGGTVNCGVCGAGTCTAPSGALASKMIVSALPATTPGAALTFAFRLAERVAGSIVVPTDVTVPPTPPGRRTCIPGVTLPTSRSGNCAMIS